ncbi:MAG: hypothetical protein RR632_05395 [Christensenella sp.]
MTAWLLCGIFVPKEPVPLTISDVMGEATALFAELFDDLYILAAFAAHDFSVHYS